MLIEKGDFPIQNQGGFWQGSSHLGEFTKSPCVIPPIPAEELDLPISLASQNPPPVVFLLVDPSLSMEGTSGESGVHEGYVGENHT